MLIQVHICGKVLVIFTCWLFPHCHFFCIKLDFGLEIRNLKGRHFKAISKGQLRVPRQLHVKEWQNERLISRAPFTFRAFGYFEAWQVGSLQIEHKSHCGIYKEYDMIRLFQDKTGACHVNYWLIYFCTCDAFIFFCFSNSYFKANYHFTKNMKKIVIMLIDKHPEEFNMAGDMPTAIPFCRHILEHLQQHNAL